MIFRNRALVIYSRSEFQLDRDFERTVLACLICHQRKIYRWQNFSYWEVHLQDNLEISIDGNLAVTTFSFAGGGKSKDGKEAKLRQLGTHMWKRLNGEWRLVHEHLTAG